MSIAAACSAGFRSLVSRKSRMPYILLGNEYLTTASPMTEHPRLEKKHSSPRWNRSSDFECCVRMRGLEFELS